MSGFALHELDLVATKADIAELHVEIADLRAEFKTDISELRSEMKTDMAHVRAEMAQLQRTIIGWMVSLFTATVAAVIGVALIS